MSKLKVVHKAEDEIPLGRLYMKRLVDDLSDHLLDVPEWRLWRAKMQEANLSPAINHFAVISQLASWILYHKSPSGIPQGLYAVDLGAPLKQIKSIQAVLDNFQVECNDYGEWDLALKLAEDAIFLFPDKLQLARVAQYFSQMAISYLANQFKEEDLSWAGLAIEEALSILAYPKAFDRAVFEKMQRNESLLVEGFGMITIAKQSGYIPEEKSKLYVATANKLLEFALKDIETNQLLTETALD